MPSIESLCFNESRRTAYVFLILENSKSLSEEILSTLNKDLKSMCEAFSMIEKAINTQVKIIAVEFNDSFRVLTENGPVSINESLDLNLKFSDISPDYERMLRGLKAIIKDYCNGFFTRYSFYALAFIFFTSGTEKKNYLDALDSLNSNRIYRYGTKVAVVSESEWEYDWEV